MLSGHLSHHSGVESNIGIVFRPIRVVGTFQVLMGNGRYDGQPWWRISIVALAAGVPDKLLQLGPESLQTLLSTKRLAEAEESDYHVSLGHLKMVVRTAEVQQAGPKGHLVRRETEVSNDQLMIGVAGVKKGLEVAEVLHSLGQRVADKHDMIAGLDAQPRLWARTGANQEQSTDDRCRPHSARVA